MLSKIRSLWYKICDDPILLILFMGSTAILLSVILGLCMGWLSVAVFWGGTVAMVAISFFLGLILPTFVSERFIPIAMSIVGVVCIFVQFHTQTGGSIQDFFASLWAEVSSLLGKFAG